MSVTQIFHAVFHLSMLEVPLQKEADCALRKLSNELGQKSHSWLQNVAYIGKNRCITHTIHLLQILSQAIDVTQGRLQTQQGWFGQSWKDRLVPASQIQIDTDALLMEDIMPALVSMCNEGMLSLSLPYQAELLTVFAQIKEYVDHPERPVSWPLAFAVHSLLTAVFEVQGPNHLTALAEASRRSFQKFNVQLGVAEEFRPMATLQNFVLCENGVNALRTLFLLVEVDIVTTDTQELLAVWNPLCAGTFLSYVAYYVNLECGGTLMDSVGQLRAILSLFNALLQVSAIAPGQVQILDWILSVFKESNAI
jgi:hypothetical protein